MTERKTAYRAKKPKDPAPPRISEHEEQANFVGEVTFRYQHREDFDATLLFAVPNGMWAGGSSREGTFGLINKLRREGYKKGVADLIYLQARGDYHYMVIEMKALDRRNEKNGGVSPEQETFLAAVNGAGGNGAVCYCCDEALKVFADYMNLPAR